MITVDMNKPLVSILVPVYNVEAYLPQCLNSLMGQTYPHLQIVLIDDGSTDGSWRVMQEYATRDERIEIFHQENQGVGATRNHLLEKIKGDYILFVDSDDWVELNMVEFLVGKASENRADVVTCGNVINDSIPKAVYEEEIWSQEKVIKEFLRHVIFNGSLWNKLIKTRLLGNHRFDCTISYGEDALFCWYIIQNASKVIVTDRQFYHYRRNPQSLSRQKWTPEKKGSGHLAWEEIVKDVSKKWPQYLNITKARFAIEDFWGIYFAAISNYPFDEHIKSRQENVRKHLKLIQQSKLINRKKILAAYVLSYCYRIGILLRYL